MSSYERKPGGMKVKGEQLHGPLSIVLLRGGGSERSHYTGFCLLSLHNGYCQILFFRKTNNSSVAIIKYIVHLISGNRVKQKRLSETNMSSSLLNSCQTIAWILISVMPRCKEKKWLESTLVNGCSCRKIFWFLHLFAHKSDVQSETFLNYVREKCEGGGIKKKNHRCSPMKLLTCFEGN